MHLHLRAGSGLPHRLDDPKQRALGLPRVLECKPGIGLLEETLPLLDGPLLAVEHGQHAQIQRREHLVVPVADLAGLRQHALVDEDLGSGLERGNEVLDELDDVLVGPVEQDGAEHVEVGAVVGLRVVEVVSDEGDAVLVFRGEHFFALSGGAGEVLYDELQLGVGGGNGEGDVAVGAAELGRVSIEYSVLTN